MGQMLSKDVVGKQMKNTDDLYPPAINVIYRLIMNVAKEWTTNDAFKLSQSS